MPPKRSKPRHRVSEVSRAPKGPPKRRLLPTHKLKPTVSKPRIQYFWRETDPVTGYLSQWYPCAFSDDKDPSIIYQTAEHYMMYQKAVLFSDPAAGAEILAAPHPRQVKALGRQINGFSDAVWHARREEIVRRGNLLKFTRPVDVEDGWWKVRVGDEGNDGGDGEGGNEKVSIRELLLRTGDREIVEASPRDRIWGIGFGAARAGSMRKRWGLNLLGKALMAVREELRKEAKGQDGTEKGEKYGEPKKE
ncbi:hypothetical protein C7999DRAFT_10993 [Corynascus novoguineensis]|uniref:NADAR domain-containing protein n=1 Tax=Corynascus novoguineensis TaxID=1126955 RepID=A0AAN7HU35_9PEZI|nr:hypothetical protein C7999DRAFT_10993 [Corynascus novoguineensis]